MLCDPYRMKTTKHQHTSPYAWETDFDKLIDAGTAASTKRAYIRDAKYFWSWVKTHLNVPQHYPAHVEHILAFCVYHLTSNSAKPLKVKTIRRYLAMLSVAHAVRGYDTPTTHAKVKLLLRRTKAAKKEQPNRKEAISISLLNKMIATCDDSLGGLRDKALLLVGFYGGGRRRHELSALMVNDLSLSSDGYQLTIQQSKTDQQCNGLTLPLSGETALAVKAWLLKSGIRDGKLFRGLKPNLTFHDGLSGKAISNIVKKRIKLAGVNPEQYGAHSLRAGFMTWMTQNGVSIHEAMQYSGHKDVETARNYVRLPDLK